MEMETKMDQSAELARLEDIIGRLQEGQDLFVKNDVLFLIGQLGTWSKRFSEHARAKHPEVACHDA